MKNKLITFCLCLLGALPLAGQTARLYTPDSGLDNTQINRIRQDRDGILWICSEGGLVRFDGQGFETLRHDRENPNSISSESVHDFYEDSRGVIWVATAEGLDIFDADYNSFSRFDLQDPRRPISNQFIVQLLEIPDRVAGSHLFVASGGNGIYVIDVQQQRLLPEKREKLYKHLTTEYIQILFLDAARHLWIVQEGGAPLVVLDADTLEPATDIRLSPELQRLDGKLRVVDIAEDPLTHNLLIATASEGLLIYEAESRILRKTRGRNASGTTAAAVLFNTQPLPENTRDFLIGSEKGGLLLFDTETESVRPGHLPGLRMDITRRKANVMFEDNQGNIWLGLYQTGLLVAPKSMFGFSYFGFNRPGVTNDEGACVMTIFADDNELWVGTDGAGLYCQLNDGTGSVTGHHATRAGYAFKWADESAETSLDHIEWSCAASTITPVAVFEPVELEGTTVKRASLCNISECERLGIGGKGSSLQVIKANKIIPKVIRVPRAEGVFQIPEICPVCNAPAEIAVSAISGTKTLKCTNPACPAKQLRKFTRFVSKQGMDIDGISESSLDRFINEGWIRHYGDIYRLMDHREEMAGLEGFGEKSVQNLSEAILRSRNVPDHRLIYALCIPLVGPDVAKRLLSAYSIDELFSLASRTEDEEFFSTIDGIGPEKSAAFVRWCHDEENMRVLALLRQEVTVTETPRAETGDRCRGLTFVVTGDVHHYKNRAELKAYIESQGGKVTGSVSGSTNYLINNDITSTSGKNQKARLLGIPVISEEDFMEKFA